MVEVKKQTTEVLVASAPCPAKIPMKTSININSIHIKEKIPLDRFLFLTIIQDAYNKIGGPMKIISAISIKLHTTKN
jgi:hypothetical protein